MISRNPVLNWTDKKRDLGGNVLKPPKDIWLRERWLGVDVAQPTQTFVVVELFQGKVRGILNRVGADAEKERDVIAAVLRKDGRVSVSERPWSLALPKRRRGKAVYVFRNDRGDQSPELTSNRVGGVAFVGEGSIGAKAPIHGLAVGTDGKATITLEVLTGVDPEMRASVLVPWDEGPLSLDTHVGELFEEVFDDPADAATAMDEFRTVYADVLPPQQPQGWEFNPNEQMSVPEGTPVRFAVEVTARTPARTLFVVQVQDVEDREGEAACSDIAELEVTEDGDVLLYADDEPELEVARA